MISDDLPAWSLEGEGAAPAALRSGWPRRSTARGRSATAAEPACAWRSSTRASTAALRCSRARSSARSRSSSTETGARTVEEDAVGDVSGHGTACAGIIRALAPACELTSVRVLGADLTGGGEALVAGLRWAVREGHHVVNLSLSTTKARFAEALRDLADEAYFGGCLLVASAHNMPVDSWPWRFAPVLSVASHAGDDPETYFYNPRPPVEFHARGMDVEVGWAAGATIRASGNSFATPHMAGMAARVLGAHPGLRPFEVKTALHLSADNVGGQ